MPFNESTRRGMETSKVLQGTGKSLMGIGCLLMLLPVVIGLGFLLLGVVFS